MSMAVNCNYIVFVIVTSSFCYQLSHWFNILFISHDSTAAGRQCGLPARFTLKLHRVAGCSGPFAGTQAITVRRRATSLVPTTIIIIWWWWYTLYIYYVLAVQWVYIQRDSAISINYEKKRRPRHSIIATVLPRRVLHFQYKCFLYYYYYYYNTRRQF